MIRPGELVITDYNWEQYVSDPVIDGQQKSRGLIPRDYETWPVGCYSCVRSYTAVEMPLIPRSEWPERIRDKVAAKAQLSDLRLANPQWKSLDQNGQGYSHVEDTEVLTDKGFVRWHDWNKKDLLATVNVATRMMEFQQATEWHAYEYDDEAYYSTNRRLDFGVTRNHRMLVRKWDERARTLSPFYSEARADELGWYVGMMPAPSGFIGTELKRLAIDGDRDYDGDDFIAMVSLIVSDGYAGGSDSTGSLVSFCCFDQRRLPAVRALAARVGFSEQPSRPGVFNRHGAHNLAAWVRVNCYAGGMGARNKRVPDLIKWASGRQIRHFLGVHGDQTHGASTPQFYSTSKRLIDDLQELHLRIGKRGSIGMAQPRQAAYAGNASGFINSSACYVLTIGSEDRLCLDRKKHVETDHYKGLVYCATVPNGTLITRRNGSVLISGNCWAYSSTAAVMYLRAVQNQPFVRLSAHAIGCMVKNFRDQGGWGAHSLEFITERGVPSVEFWAEKSMSRANDKPETWENAKLHRVSEGWVDLSAAVYNRKLTFDQVCSLNLAGIPTVDDYNSWGHSVCGIDVVDGAAQWSLSRAGSGKRMSLQEFERFWGIHTETTGFSRRIQNSWGDGWSEQGMGILTGNKCIPDGGAAPRVTTPSVG